MSRRRRRRACWGLLMRQLPDPKAILARHTRWTRVQLWTKLDEGPRCDEWRGGSLFSSSSLGLGYCDCQVEQNSRDRQYKRLF